MKLNFEELVHALGTPANLVVNSTDKLADDVEEQARTRIGPKRASAYMYRKRLSPVDSELVSGIESSPAEVLRELGLATTFVAVSPFADIARHWAHVRYCATMTQTPKRVMALSKAGSDIVHHHKVAQSEQIGIGLALVVAKRILERKHPGWIFSAVDVDVTLAAGFLDGVGLVRQKKQTTMRPDYFLVGRRADVATSACKVVILECKGTHGSSYHSKQQLATASLQVGAIDVASKTLPSLIVASRLLVSGISVDVLDPPGDEDLWSGESEEFDELVTENPESPEWSPGRPSFEQFVARQSALRQVSEDELVRSQAERARFEEIQEHLPLIFSIPESGKSWLFRTLSRSAAHSVLRFAGDNRSAVRFETPRNEAQRSLPLDEPIPEWQNSAIDVEARVGSNEFVGMKYSMPLPGGKSFEVFRGVERGSYERLREGRVSAYLRRARRFNEEWRDPVAGEADAARSGVLSVGSDGTILTVRLE